MSKENPRPCFRLMSSRPMSWPGDDLAAGVWPRCGLLCIVAISVSGRDNYQHRIYCRHQGRSSRGVCEKTGLVREWKHGAVEQKSDQLRAGSDNTHAAQTHYPLNPRDTALAWGTWLGLKQFVFFVKSYEGKEHLVQLLVCSSSAAMGLALLLVKAILHI